MMARMQNPLRTAMALLGVAGLALALAGCTFSSTPVAEPTAPPTATGTTTPVPVAAGPCQDAFSPAIEWDSDPEVPQVAYIVVTNNGAAACSLTGFPSAIRYVDEDGSSLTVGYESMGSTDDFDRSATPVVVDPGAQAYIWTWILQNADRDGSNTCQFPGTAAGLGLTLPGATRPIVAPADLEICLDDAADDVKYGPVDSERRMASKGY